MQTVAVSWRSARSFFFCFFMAARHIDRHQIVVSLQGDIGGRFGFVLLREVRAIASSLQAPGRRRFFQARARPGVMGWVETVRPPSGNDAFGFGFERVGGLLLFFIGAFGRLNLPDPPKGGMRSAGGPKT